MTLTDAIRCRRCGRWRYSDWLPVGREIKPPQICVCRLPLESYRYRVTVSARYHPPIGTFHGVPGWPVNLVEERG